MSPENILILLVAVIAVCQVWKACHKSSAEYLAAVSDFECDQAPITIPVDSVAPEECAWKGYSFAPIRPTWASKEDYAAGLPRLKTRNPVRPEPCEGSEHAPGGSPYPLEVQIYPGSEPTRFESADELVEELRVGRTVSAQFEDLEAELKKSKQLLNSQTECTKKAEAENERLEKELWTLKVKPFPIGALVKMKGGERLMVVMSEIDRTGTYRCVWERETEREQACQGKFHHYVLELVNNKKNKRS